MEYNIESILNLLVKNNYLTPLEFEFLKQDQDKINVRQQSTTALRENLTISLEGGKLSQRNIRDFKSLLKATENVKDDYILCVNIKYKGNRNIYIDNSVQIIFDEL